MVALIREILISTLRHDDLETQAFLAGTLLILGAGRAGTGACPYCFI